MSNTAFQRHQAGPCPPPLPCPTSGVGPPSLSPSQQPQLPAPGRKYVPT
ncbi:unnamed protein product, partial [Ectocarpus sp. 12 AP-2014]